VLLAVLTVAVRVDCGAAHANSSLLPAARVTAASAR
jgi:hypothetical protein